MANAEREQGLRVNLKGKKKAKVEAALKPPPRMHGVLNTVNSGGGACKGVCSSPDQLPTLTTTNIKNNLYIAPNLRFGLHTRSAWGGIDPSSMPSDVSLIEFSRIHQFAKQTSDRCGGKICVVF